MPSRVPFTLPPGVTFLQHGWMSANSVLLQGDQAVVIDTGHVNGYSALTDELRAHGLAPGDLHAVWLTHAHSDHAGGTAALQAAGAEVWAHPETARRVNAWDERAMWITYADQMHERFTVTREIDGGEGVTINGLTFVPVYTPGHAGGMVALHVPAHRLLITADALWENGFGPLAPDIEGDDVIDQQRATVRRLAELDVDLVLPGHGPPFDDLAGACARAMSRLDAYAQDPRRPARSLVRAYFVHHLFEAGGMPEADATAYFRRVPAYADTHARCFADTDPETFWAAFVEDLIDRKSVARDGGRLISIENAG